MASANRRQSSPFVRNGPDSCIRLGRPRHRRTALSGVLSNFLAIEMKPLGEFHSTMSLLSDPAPSIEELSPCRGTRRIRGDSILLVRMDSDLF